jgi:hypothetical membrane protein
VNHSPTNHPAVPATRRPATIRLLATAGLVGPTLFAVLVLAQQTARRDTYDPTAQLVSDLTAGPYGWIQQVTFILFGVLLITFAVGLQIDVRPDRPTRIAPAIVAFNGAGLVVAGIFPLQARPHGQVHDPLGVHTANGVVFFLTIGVVLCGLSVPLRGDPRWRGIAPYTLTTGLALLLLFAAVVTLVRPPDAPLHHWLGAIQRIVVIIWLSGVVVLALRLRRLARTRPDQPTSRR